MLSQANIDYFLNRMLACYADGYPHLAYDYLRYMVQHGYLAQSDLAWWLGVSEGVSNA
jgi:hypothetical protein